MVSTMNPSIPYWWVGRSIAIREEFSAPAPFGSTVTVNVVPGFTWIAGIPAPVLSPVLCRVSGSTTFGRNGISRVAFLIPSATASYRSLVKHTSGGIVRYTTGTSVHQAALPPRHFSGYWQTHRVLQGLSRHLLPFGSPAVRPGGGGSRLRG